MRSSYEVGDQATTNDGTSVQIIKVVSNGDRHPLYLVQDVNQNHFTYQTQLKMSSSDSFAEKRRRRPSHKRQKSDSSDSKLSDGVHSSTPWSLVAVDKLNIKFHGNVRPDRKVAFAEFFENEFPEKNDPRYEKLVNWRWDDDLTSLPDDIDAVARKLLAQSEEFQIIQSEASVEACVRLLFELFKLEPLSEKIDVHFGRVDMIISERDSTVSPMEMMRCAVEIKGSKAYNVQFREKCRDQLSAYMVSLAMENILNAKTEGETLTTQKIFGILHFGLTPIFYKTEISNEYIESILRLHHNDCTDKPQIPELRIHEFRPILRYNDRELLRRSSRSIIFKCYEALKVMMQI